ncbi:nucleotidyl transferase AbiEii/AbiGii toxin family protein [Thalassolituus oleivorans]|uniref:nucleotidyl transferase AbiEii/AbiGii toxin family protein n=1 Tax=Thalassolituus oleivorans TaxID=187493 RepID=UPI001670B5D7|nr:nucleotidyl transferase AbiEii/AbiGii toxin family protein [Thalassolituus oleivorans]
MTNKAASIRQKLLNLSRERGESFDFVLQQYAIQRLLYRLSVSEYHDQFLLKGAMLFSVWTGDLHRPTKDIDLLGFGSNDTDVLVNDFKVICAIEADDGLIFDIESIQGVRIKEDSLYQGVRVTGFAHLEKAKIGLQVDIGFGDAVTPNARLATIPSFLDFPAPIMKIYPVYTVIAEKFHAMVALGLFNSRIKDFYDIWMIAIHGLQEGDFLLGEDALDGTALDGTLLVSAIRSTFNRRNTVMSPEMLSVFTAEFMQDTNKHKQWNAFLNKNRIVSDQSFENIQQGLRRFLEPAYQAAALGAEYPFKWDVSEGKWK